jgi:probable F420-dependent oxidoreductase
MQWGIQIFCTDRSIQPIELGVAVESAGFDALFVTEHTHIPVSRRTPFVGGGELPDEYRRTHDPIVALTAAAAATERILLGTGVLLAAQHDPIVLAKQVASLDLVSGGRFVFGVGAGWNLEELASHGVSATQRFAVLRERILAMRTIWREDVAEFVGEHVAFEPMWSYPKPLQRPHPPVLLGGMGATVVDRVLDYADGWCPAAGEWATDLPRRISELHERARAADTTRQVWVFHAPTDLAALDELRAAGIDGAVFAMPSLAQDEAIDWIASLRTELNSIGR